MYVNINIEDMSGVNNLSIGKVDIADKSDNKIDKTIDIEDVSRVVYPHTGIVNVDKADNSGMTGIINTKEAKQ